MGLKYRSPPFDPCLCYVHRRGGGAVGAAATHIDAISGCEEQCVLSKTGVFSEVHLSSIERVGMEMSRGNDYSAQLTQEEFSPELQPLVTSPGLWTASEQLLSQDVVRRQEKLGELR